jgi:dolichyl-phosphate beta-glucosyltransferase
MRVHVVVPCYEEGARLDRQAFSRFIGRQPDVVFTLVNDGSRDNTLEVLEEIRACHPNRVRVLDLPVNVGKAEAVRRGINAAVAEGPAYVGYWDADLATPLESIPDLAKVLDDHQQIDIVLGARVLLLGRRIERKPMRHLAGRVFATGASLTLGLPVYDTQCGAKILRRGPLVDKLFERPFNSRWIFDVEMIARYLQEGGTMQGLYEASLPEWTDVAGSKVRPIDFFRAFGELVGLYNAYPLGQPLRRVVLFFTNAFTRYVGVGALGTLLHFAVLVTLVEVFRVKPAAAAVAGASAGALVNYYLNYHLTFASKRSHRATFPRFVVVALLGMLVSGLGVRMATTAGVHYLLAQVLCTMVILIVGFLINRDWTFKG